MNHTSAAADVERVLDWFASAQVPGQRRAAAARSPVRHADVRDGWLGEPAFSRSEVAAAAIFAGLDDAQLDCAGARGLLRGDGGTDDEDGGSP
jgi:hypothetical protein